MVYHDDIHMYSKITGAQSTYIIFRKNVFNNCMSSLEIINFPNSITARNN